MRQRDEFGECFYALCFVVTAWLTSVMVAGGDGVGMLIMDVPFVAWTLWRDRARAPR